MRIASVLAVALIACGSANESASDPVAVGVDASTGQTAPGWLAGPPPPLPAGATPPATPAFADCETNIDAGTPCEPCPGNVRSVQSDWPASGEGTIRLSLPDGGAIPVLTFRECNCPAGSKMAGIVWRSCAPIPAGYDGHPATTCAQIASEFAAACAR